MVALYVALFLLLTGRLRLILIARIPESVLRFLLLGTDLVDLLLVRGKAMPKLPEYAVHEPLIVFDAVEGVALLVVVKEEHKGVARPRGLIAGANSFWT
jgi:hypothetical protein